MIIEEMTGHRRSDGKLEKMGDMDLEALEKQKVEDQKAVDKEIQEELEKQFIQSQGVQTVQDTEKADTVR